MKIQHNYNLSKLNTFGISVNAKFFVEISNENDVKELFNTMEFKNSEKLFLGGGSNVLFTKDFDGLVVLNKLKGIEILQEEAKNMVIRSMGGESWRDLVIFAVERGLWGIENLALIPGTVGAAPIQNIGAYGAELKNVLENVEAYNIESGEKKVFTKEECKLGYRDSIFKNELRGKYFITAITLRLSKIENKNITYKILQEYLEKNKIEIKNSKDVSDAVSAIRKSKLPDPVEIPNAGSFFKNPVLSRLEYEQFESKFVIGFGGEALESLRSKFIFQGNNGIKIPAAFLIEQSGWKGKRVGNVGVHDKQALVLVNYGGATGQEIKNLAEQIIVSVFSKFGVLLIPEVNFF